MKERGIIFSAPMVRALLAGQKTMTRRTVKPKQAERLGVGLVGISARLAPDAPAAPIVIPEGVCPYGQPGDRLWVREAHQYCDEQLDGYTRDDPVCVLYRADMVPYRFEPTPRRIPNQHADEWRLGRWHPSIHLPRWASRITLEIDAVRVERLHEITEADARAEGAAPAPFTKAGRPADQLHVEGFEALWESLHGAGSWALNPWLWVIEFKMVTR